MKKSIAAASALIAVLGLVGCSAPATSSQSGAQASEGAKTTDETESTAPKPEVKVYENGDHIVGTDIKAGVYRAEVEDGIIALCNVTQSKENGDVMDLRNANEGSVIFTVKNKKGSVVSFSGCANTTLAKDALRKGAKPGNGWFLVGDELAPGKYSGSVDTESAMKLGTVSQFNAKGTVMDLRNANAGKVVFTVKKSKGSVVSFSGFSKVKKIG